MEFRLDVPRELPAVSVDKALLGVATSRTEVGHRDWARKMGDAVFMEKPLSMRRLLELLDGRFRGHVEPEGC
jgi:hypothetical protein